MKKVAIFVDWENIRIGIFEESAKKLHQKVDYNQIENIINFIYSFLAFSINVPISSVSISSAGLGGIGPEGA